MVPLPFPTLFYFLGENNEYISHVQLWNLQENIVLTNFSRCTSRNSNYREVFVHPAPNEACHVHVEALWCSER